jgi:hypothetical protein
MSGIGWKSSLQRPAVAGRHGTPHLRRTAAKYLWPGPPKSLSSVAERDLGLDVKPSTSKLGVGHQAVAGAGRGRSKSMPHPLEAWSPTRHLVHADSYPKPTAADVEAWWSCGGGGRSYHNATTACSSRLLQSPTLREVQQAKTSLR